MITIVSLIATLVALKAFMALVKIIDNWTK